MQHYGGMEVSEVSKKENSLLILKKFFKDITYEDDKWEMVISKMEEEGYSLDLWPAVVPDNNYKKYNQVEVFYQRCLDGEMSKKEFKSAEYKYHQFVKTLWLYSDVYAYVDTDIEQFKKSRRRYNRKSGSVLQEIIQSENEMVLVESANVLEDVVYLATHNIASVLLFFTDLKMVIFLDDCFGIVYCVDEDYKFALKIATVNQLYMFKRKNVRQEYLKKLIK